VIETVFVDPAPRLASKSHFFRDLWRVLESRWARVVVATVCTEGIVVFGALAFIPTHLHFARGFALSIAILWICLVAFSRLVLGVHWPTDVLAAACIGVSLPLAMSVALELRYG
jgi:hypothetical protein